MRREVGGAGGEQALLAATAFGTAYAQLRLPLIPAGGRGTRCTSERLWARVTLDRVLRA